ncbi:MAG: DUF3006 domain-containing protein [Treponema sp.]|nr:DUF3006 domain-containing protein [Treponema sp.]
MKLVVDRIEGDVTPIAVCCCLEIDEDFEISLSELPPGIKEGDVITREGNTYTYDEALTKKRMADITARMNRLFDNNRPQVPQC